MRTLTVPATLDSLSVIGQFVLEVAAEASLNTLAAHRTRLAIDEIATNAIVYGGAIGDGQGVLEVHAEISEHAVMITLEDVGIHFDPRQVAPPDDMDSPLEERQVGGLGVHLALTGVDQFSYERVGHRNRNIFVVKRVPPSAERREGNASPQPVVADPVTKESRA